MGGCHWWALALLVLLLRRREVSSTRVDPRTGALLGSNKSLFPRPIYVPAPSTEAPLNPHAGHYAVRENIDEGNEFTPRPLPRVFYDPRIPEANQRPVPLPTARPWDEENFLEQDYLQEQRINSKQFRGGYGQLRQQQLQAYQQGAQNRLQQHRRGYSKKGFRNYENRQNWGRRTETHYGIDDPRLRVGYENFIRFFGDFSSGKGSYGDLRAYSRSGRITPGTGMELPHGAYGMPLYAPTFDEDYNYDVIHR